MKTPKNYSVYILKCPDETFYTGITNNVEQRVGLHNAGKGAKYTRGRHPCQMFYVESGFTKSLALKREHQIKKLKRSDKKKLGKS